MAQYNGRYIQFYTPGSAAVKVQIQEEQKWAPLPEPKPEKKILIPADPVAILGFVVAISMLVLMMIGINQLNFAIREVATLEHYVAQLTTENYTLEQTYREGYDLEDIQQKALDLGMVSAEEIPQTQIKVAVPSKETVETIAGWKRITTYLADLFA